MARQKPVVGVDRGGDRDQPAHALPQAEDAGHGGVRARQGEAEMTIAREAVRAGLLAAKDAAHDAYECDMDHAGIAARAVAAFLRALPVRFPMPRPGGVTWGHSAGEMARLAALVEAASDARNHNPALRRSRPAQTERGAVGGGLGRGRRSRA